MKHAEIRDSLLCLKIMSEHGEKGEQNCEVQKVKWCNDRLQFCNIQI